MSAGLTRADAEDLLFAEAALIDDRRFREWLELFTADALYWVPGHDPDLDPSRQVSIIYDDSHRRAARVERLEHRSNWRDDPPGRLLHVVSNVVVEAPDSDGEVAVTSNQVVYHSRQGRDLTTATRCSHRFRPVDGSWRIAAKKVLLVSGDYYPPPAAIVLL